MPCGNRRVGRWVAAILLAGVLAIDGRGAAAELVHTTDYRTHPVHGTTPRALWQYMNAHPIIDPDDGPAYANLTHDHDVAMKTATAGGLCRVSDLTFRWRFVLTLPKAVDQGGMNSATRSMWNGFVAAVKQHEETHRAIFLRCGARFVPAAQRLTAAGCAALQRKVRRSIDQAYQACMAEQRAFENRDRSRILGLAFVKAAGSQ